MGKKLVLIVATLIVTLLFLRLGVWQLDRYQQRRARNETREARGALPSLVWGPGAPPPADTAGLVGRRVRVTGRYDPAREVILRNRSTGAWAGVEVVTPLFVREDGPALFVLRGWLPAPDGVRARLSEGWGDVSPDSTVEVSGVVIAAAQAVGPPLEVDIEGRPHMALAAIDLAQLRQHLPFEISPVVLRADDPPPESPALRPASQPLAGNGPHLSYAIQWFSFALISVVGTTTLLMKEKRGELR